MSKNIAVGGTRISLGGNAVNVRRDLPRISVEGTNFKRLGVTFKPYGVQPLYTQPTVDAYYNSTGSTERAAMAQEMQGNASMGFNVFRTHIQMWTFIEGTYGSLSVKQTQMDNLIYQLDLARKNDMYVLLCGANCWNPTNTPAWYDSETNANRWNVQQYFWEQVVTAIDTAGLNTTILGYDIINEPAVSTDAGISWYRGNFGDLGIYYSCFIARGVASEDINSTVQAWLTQIRDAIKAIDPLALVTFGNAAEFVGQMGRDNTQDIIDFAQPHIYPPSGEGDATVAIAYIDGWATATIPVVCGETIAVAEPSVNVEIWDEIATDLEGIISFSYGYAPEFFPPIPEPTRPPAKVDGQGISYQIQKASLELFLTYKTDFIPA